jgi:K+-sensing histidine kinase KdpD
MESSMKRRVQKLTEARLISAIENVTGILTTGTDLETALQQTLDYIVSKIQAADISIIWGFDPPAEQLVPRNASGIDTGTIAELQTKPGTGIVGRVFLTGKRELYPSDKDLQSEEANIPKIPESKHLGLLYSGSTVCLPLNTDTNKYGVLAFLNPGNKTGFRLNSISFFQTIANCLTMAMERAEFIKGLKAKELSGMDDRYRAGLIPTLVHEMRTPLTSIKGYATALQMEDLNFSTETQREFLEFIDKECDTLEGLISDYLESSAIDAGKMEINLQPVRLTHLAAKAAEDIGRRFPRHSLVVDIAPEFPLIYADPERIFQVLRQLLDNAAKYSPNGGLIVLQGKVEEDRVIISVSDEGVGIKPEDLNHLFERFFRAKLDSGNESRIVGTGLGLPISRAIVEAHNGRIWAESQLGQGSKFCFSLPVNNTDHTSAE